jgi:hypothetical protein
MYGQRQQSSILIDQQVGSRVRMRRLMFSQVGLTEFEQYGVESLIWSRRSNSAKTEPDPCLTAKQYLDAVQVIGLSHASTGPPI